MKKVTLLIIVFFMIASFSPVVQGDYDKKNDVYIDAGDSVDEHLWASQEDEIHFFVNSTEPVSVYIIDDVNYDNIEPKSSNFSRAAFTADNITSLEHEWKQPDDKDYYLIIVNYGSKTAVVDYSYTDVLSGKLKDSLEALSTLCIGVLIALVLIIIGIIVVIVLLIRESGEDSGPQPPPPPPPR